MEYIILFIIIAAILVVVLVMRATRTAGLSSYDRQIIMNKWKAISEEKDFRKSVLEADKLVDFALKELRYEGQFGEKLKKAHNLFSDINGIWEAHKLRNRIAHELDVEVSEQDGSKALRNYKKALQDLGIKV